MSKLLEILPPDHPAYTQAVEAMRCYHDAQGNSEQVAHQPEMGGLGMPKSPIFSH